MIDVNRTYQTYMLQDYERMPKLLLAQIDYLIEMFDLEVQNEKGKPIVITLREKQSHSNHPPIVTAELNNCPTHGAVDKDHRCSEFDGMLRDAWTVDPIPRRPTDNVKYLGMTENGTRYTP